MKKLLSLTILALTASFASYAIDPIIGDAGSCVGAYGYLMDSTMGGTWSSSNPAIATVGPTTGYVMGISAGTVTISYTVGTSVATWPYVVSPTPAMITGSLHGCPGTTSALSDATPGGIWSTSTPSVASVGSVSGVLSQISTGYTYVYYTVGPGCHATAYDTVTGPTTPDSIAGPTNVCVGFTITLTDPTPGGVWSSSNPAVATINATTGVVTGVTNGTAVMAYTISGTCGSAAAYYPTFVTSTSSPGTITGSGTVSIGGGTTLSDGVSGGTWSSSNPSVATITSSTGYVTGVSAGTVTMTYTIVGCSGPVYATHTMTVSAPTTNRISGYIYFTGPAVDSSNPIKVWLIHYDAVSHLLTAVDSTITYSGGTSAYYYFNGEPADTYRVKAAYIPALFTSTGYIPTYHTSSLYWSTATTFVHSVPGADDNKNITMAYGTVTTGPGFIAGDVTTGANKGTTGTAPTVNQLVFCRNATGNVVGQAYTNGAGHYSFSNLPLGTYTVYPEDINYATTAYTGITLTATSASMSAANFGKHSISKTILPMTTGINTVSNTASSVIVFPNPANGKLNIQWNELANETAVVTISDVAGRIMSTSSVTMTQGTGVNQVDVTNLASGIYMINVKSASINFNNKIQIQH